MKLTKGFVFIYFFLGAYLVSMLYFAFANFWTTTFLYSLIIFGLYKFYTSTKKYKIFIFSSLLIVLSLYLCEIISRFIYTKYVSYNELDGGFYVSNQKSLLYEQIHFINIQGRKDIHTLEFDPFEERNISSVENIIRPNEKYNRLGLRGDIPDSSKRVIVTFGDSFTEGACVTIDSSYPVLFENMIRTIDNDFRVLNAGVSGNDPFFDSKMLFKLNKKFPIERAIFLINTTDLDDVSQRGGNERFLSGGGLNYVETPWWERIYAFSYLFRVYVHNVLRLDYTFSKSDEREKKNIDSIQKIKQHFENDVLPFCIENNIKVTIAIHPIFHELDNNFSIYKIMSKEFSQIKNIEFVDTFSDLKHQSQKTKTFYMLDGHCTGIGYFTIARAIFEKIEDELVSNKI
jgi:hypothetical protein